MKRRSEDEVAAASFEDLIGLGNQSARKTYHAELATTIEQLEAERNHYKWLFDNALHGIFQASLVGELIDANPAMAHLCGYADQTQLQQQLPDLRQLFETPASFALLVSLLRDRGLVRGYETRIRRADGELRDVALNVLLKEENGISLVEACIQDVTERVQAQRNLQQVNEILESRVAARTTELTRLNEQLRQEITEREQIEQQLHVAVQAAEQANQSKDKYLAAASHDLLQPMNAARLLVAALLERDIGPQENHLVERVHRALEGAEQLLTDLLDIARLDQNGVQPDPTDFSLNCLFETLQAEFQPLAAQAGLQLRVRSADLVIHSDMRLLLRILRNLLTNAIRYTGEGRVLLGYRREGDQLSLQVWDSGDGIPANRLQDIFQAFQQLECHSQGERKGVGLGLAIVERIAGVLQHSINVSSRPGRGSMFSVTVPLVENPQAVLPAVELAPVLDSLEGCQCLVIDNDENILVSMHTLLTQWGAQVVLAEDQAQALAACEDGFIPNVILADYHLNNDQVGTDAIAAVRALLGDIPAMLITADRSDSARRHYREQGLPMLNKPVKPGKLRALLTHLLMG